MNSLTVFGGALLCAIAARFALKKRQRLPLPPGPPADPLIGHLRVFPDPTVTPEVFYEWSLKYGEYYFKREEMATYHDALIITGDVFSLQVLGKTIVVVNSEKAANELFEKRSAIYSDRARMGYYDQ